MSYAHTKRRKNIARLKRNHPRTWQAELDKIAQAQIKKQEGPFFGSLQDLMAQEFMHIRLNPPESK